MLIKIILIGGLGGGNFFLAFSTNITQLILHGSTLNLERIFSRHYKNMKKPKNRFFENFYCD